MIEGPTRVEWYKVTNTSVRRRKRKQGKSPFSRSSTRRTLKVSPTRDGKVPEKGLPVVPTTAVVAETPVTTPLECDVPALGRGTPAVVFSVVPLVSTDTSVTPTGLVGKPSWTGLLEVRTPFPSLVEGQGPSSPTGVDLLTQDTITPDICERPGTLLFRGLVDNGSLSRDITRRNEGGHSPKGRTEPPVRIIDPSPRVPSTVPSPPTNLC